MSSITQIVIVTIVLRLYKQWFWWSYFVSNIVIYNTIFFIVVLCILKSTFNILPLTQVVFLLMEAIILFLSILITFPDSAITALLCFVLLFVLLFIFLLSISIEFFSFIYSVVYTGAILMLFLFILMFYNRKTVVSVHLKVIEFFLVLFNLIYSLYHYINWKSISK